MKGFTRDHKFVPMTDYKKVTRKSRDSQTKLQGVRLRRDKKIPVYNTKVNVNDKRKPFKMWIVKHPEGSDVIKGSVTTVMAEHYGQAIDDYITIWNKENRMNRKIGYPVVQGTADKSFRYKRDKIRKVVNSKVKITQPMIKGKLDSIFYAGEIATMKAKDGTVFELDAVGEVRFTIDDREFRDIDDAVSEFGLNDKKLHSLMENGRLELEHNNWFEVTTSKASGAEVGQPIEEYDSAINHLEDTVDQYNKGELVF